MPRRYVSYSTATAVHSALLSCCVHQIPSGGAAECHEGTSPTAVDGDLLSCCVHQTVHFV